MQLHSQVLELKSGLPGLLNAARAKQRTVKDLSQRADMTTCEG